MGNRRLYPEPHRRPVAVWNKAERPRLGGSRCAAALCIRLLVPPKPVTMPRRRQGLAGRETGSWA